MAIFHKFFCWNVRANVIHYERLLDPNNFPLLSKPWGGWRGMGSDHDGDVQMENTDRQTEYN